VTTDRVTGTLTEENRQQILDLIEQAKAQMPYLLDLSTEEQRTLLRLRDKTEAFVRQAQDVASRNPEILPRAFDLEQVHADVDLYFALRCIQWALIQFKELVDDTVSAVGSEAYASALEVYRYAKYNGAEGLDQLRELMAQRFNRGPGGSGDGAEPAVGGAA
jgi:hypothetical protein